jgi:hypothetical protein
MLHLLFATCYLLTGRQTQWFLIIPRIANFFSVEVSKTAKQWARVWRSLKCSLPAGNELLSLECGSAALGAPCRSSDLYLVPFQSNTTMTS